MGIVSSGREHCEAVCTALLCRCFRELIPPILSVLRSAFLLRFMSVLGINRWERGLNPRLSCWRRPWSGTNISGGFGAGPGAQLWPGGGHHGFQGRDGSLFWGMDCSDGRTSTCGKVFPAGAFEEGELSHKTQCAFLHPPVGSLSYAFSASRVPMHQAELPPSI